MLLCWLQPSAVRLPTKQLLLSGVIQISADASEDMAYQWERSASWVLPPLHQRNAPKYSLSFETFFTAQRLQGGKPGI